MFDICWWNWWMFVDAVEVNIDGLIYSKKTLSTSTDAKIPSFDAFFSWCSQRRWHHFFGLSHHFLSYDGPAAEFLKPNIQILHAYAIIIVMDACIQQANFFWKYWIQGTTFLEFGIQWFLHIYQLPSKAIGHRVY